MMMIRPAAHMSSAYHRANQYEPVGSYCDRKACDSPHHVAPYLFYCINPHCMNAAHNAAPTPAPREDTESV